MDESIDYQAMMQSALQGVVRDLLEHVAEEGLPGAHHFYIGFRTGDPGVSLPQHLRNRYPREMTIVLQNQFSGLQVGEGEFSVTVRFSGKPTALTVPFASLTSFVDPSVPFGLRFDFDLIEGAAEGDSTADVEGTCANGVSRPTTASVPVLTASSRHRPAPAHPGQVVSIKEFRRKD